MEAPSKYCFHIGERRFVVQTQTNTVLGRENFKEVEWRWKLKWIDDVEMMNLFGKLDQLIKLTFYHINLSKIFFKVVKMPFLLYSRNGDGIFKYAHLQSWFFLNSSQSPDFSWVKFQFDGLHCLHFVEDQRNFFYEFMMLEFRESAFILLQLINIPNKWHIKIFPIKFFMKTFTLYLSFINDYNWNGMDLCSVCFHSNMVCR